MIDQTALDRLSQWKQNPAQFVTDIWGAHLEPFQLRALRGLVEHGRVSVRSGHGVGKSTLMAWSVIWYLMTHYPAKVPCTAPTAHQLDDVLWPEIAHWHQRMPNQFRALFEHKTDKFEL